MTPSQQDDLFRWITCDAFSAQTLQQAADRLAALAPDYAEYPFRPVAVGIDGTRWFKQREQAIADAVWRATRRLFDPDETLTGRRWAVACNEDCLWAVGWRGRAR